MTPFGRALRWLWTAGRRVALVLVSAGLLVVILLGIGFAGPVAGAVLLLWLAVLAAELWLLVRERMGFEGSAWAMLGALAGLVLPPVFIGRAISRSAAGSTVMGIVYFALFLLPVALGIWIAVRRVRRRRARGREVYLGLRAQALAMRPQDLGLTTASNPAAPYGILLESSSAQGGFTLVCFATGDASLYFTHGGGILGGAGHEPVRRAARAFVAASEPFLGLMQRTQTFPLPGPGRTRFFVLTPTGVFTAEASTEDLGKGRDRLSEVFHHGNAVLAALRQLDEGQRGGSG